MLSKIINRLLFFLMYGYRFCLSGSVIKGVSGASIKIEKGVKIKNSTIFAGENSSLIIKGNTIITDTILNIKGSVVIGKNNIINKGGAHSKVSFNVDGNLKVGNNNRLQCRILMRYGSNLCIGDYNNINYDSEVRADEQIIIGSFNQVSYNVVIWDTNTHSIYPSEERRKLAIKHYPIFGYEYERPKTKPVFIGDDCWVGKNVSILKGSEIENSCIIGYQVTISGEKIQKNTTVVTEIINNKIHNNI